MLHLAAHLFLTPPRRHPDNPMHEPPAFPELLALLTETFDIDELAAAVLQGMGLRLDRIVYVKKDVPAVVTEVLLWGERHGRTTELLRALYLARPDDEAVKDVARRAGVTVDNDAPSQNV